MKKMITQILGVLSILLVAGITIYVVWHSEYFGIQKQNVCLGIGIIAWGLACAISNPIEISKNTKKR